MSTYFVESQDRSVVNFEAYDTCTDSRKKSVEMAVSLGIPMSVYKSLTFPANRDNAFLLWTAYQDRHIDFIELPLDDAITQVLEQHHQ